MGLADEQRIENEISISIKALANLLTIGPLLAIVYDAISTSQLMTDALGMYFLYVTFGLFFSLPVFLLYLLTFNKIVKTKKSSLTVKVILNILAVVGVIVTFSLIKGTSTFMASIFYSVALIVVSTFYRVRQKEINEQTIDVPTTRIREK